MRSIFQWFGSLILSLPETLLSVADYYKIIRKKYGKPLPKKEVKFLLFLVLISILIDIIIDVLFK